MPTPPSCKWALIAMVVPAVAAGAAAAAPALVVSAPSAHATGEAAALPAGHSGRETEASGIVAGVTAVENPAQLDRVSATLSELFNTPLERVTARLRRLRRLDGAGVYVEIRQAKLPVRVVLDPHSGDQVSLAANWVLKTPVTPQRAGTSGVAVFWVDRETQPEYLLQVPAHATRLTLVVNGREVASAQPIRHAEGRVTFLARR